MGSAVNGEEEAEGLPHRRCVQGPAAAVVHSEVSATTTWPEQAWVAMVTKWVPPCRAWLSTPCRPVLGLMERVMLLDGSDPQAQSSTAILVVPARPATCCVVLCLG